MGLASDKFLFTYFLKCAPFLLTTFPLPWEGDCFGGEPYIILLLQHDFNMTPT